MSDEMLIGIFDISNDDKIFTNFKNCDK